MRDKKCIVTGGAGFIGSHLTEALLKSGLQVVVIDNLSGGRTDNIKDFSGHQNFKFVNADINNVQEIAHYFKGAGYVFHLAALADIVPSIVNPLAYYHANVQGTINILEIVRGVCPEIKKFIYTASSSCYGIPDKYPTPESAEIRPEYPYALTKYLGEEIVLHWSKIYKLPVTSLRLFNVYGPRSRTSGTYGAVFGVFLAQKSAGRPYTVVGDGTQVRDFTYVTDVVRAFIAASQSDSTGDVFNVGSGKPSSINHLVELLGGQAVHIPKRPGEPDSTFADISRIKESLKWKAEVAFEEGVKIMLDNISYWKEAPVWTPDAINKATKDWFAYLTK